MSQRVGYVGLGGLGSPIAVNLAKHASTASLPALIIWNRSKERYGPVKAEASDVVEADEVEDVVRGSDVVFTCLLNDSAAEEIYGKMFKAVEKGRKVIFVDQSTLNPKTSGTSASHAAGIALTVPARLAAQAKDADCTYLSSPVFGQPAAAKAKLLVCILAGPAAEKEVVKPLLEAIGRKTLDVGEDVKNGPFLCIYIVQTGGDVMTSYDSQASREPHHRQLYTGL